MRSMSRMAAFFQAATTHELDDPRQLVGIEPRSVGSADVENDAGPAPKIDSIHRGIAVGAANIEFFSRTAVAPLPRIWPRHVQDRVCRGLAALSHHALDGGYVEPDPVAVGTLVEQYVGDQTSVEGWVGCASRASPDHGAAIGIGVGRHIDLRTAHIAVLRAVKNLGKTPRTSLHFERGLTEFAAVVRRRHVPAAGRAAEHTGLVFWLRKAENLATSAPGARSGRSARDVISTATTRTLDDHCLHNGSMSVTVSLQTQSFAVTSPDTDTHDPLIGTTVGNLHHRAQTRGRWYGSGLSDSAPRHRQTVGAQTPT